jgi:Lhr-like helicase
VENVFNFRDRLVAEYSSFSRSFTRIAAPDILGEVERQYEAGRYWPEPLIQINPNYQRKNTVQQLVEDGLLHEACATIFQTGKQEGRPQPTRLYAHQMQAVAKGQAGQSYVVTTGTGSGKSLSFFLPIIDSILKGRARGEAPRTRAIVIYPMNALANSQLEELDKFLHGYAAAQRPFTVARYTGQERQAERQAIAENPPDILLTNFMMLELILTRHEQTDLRVVEHCNGLEFLVLDELHTYRGRQGADVALLVRRLRERLQASSLTCIGTSATMSSAGKLADRNKTVAAVASKLFGVRITEHDVIGETLERVTDPARDVAAIKSKLRSQLGREIFAWTDFDDFRQDPLAVWVELTLGIELSDEEAPRRAKPITLREASERLMHDAGCSLELAKEGLQRFLVAAHELRTPQGSAPFAFKLHQFISGPGKVHTTLEAPGIRHVTLDAQRFAPGRQADAVLLYPAHFCRDCGQEYHPVWRTGKGQVRYSPREIDDITADDNEEASFGFLCPHAETQNYAGQLEDLPESWLDLTKAEPKVKTNYRKVIPHRTMVDAQGTEGRGEPYWFIPGKFRFCLNCSLLHEAHGKDMNRLASLSGEGRSSATTILTLSALRQLYGHAELPEGLPDPRKLLGFSDNRQDAALQAGHFNDFIFLLTLRSGLVGALQDNRGLLTEEHLADAVFMALGFNQIDAGTLSEYLRSPKLMGLARQEAQRTLRYIIGYRLLRDLRRGWRFNNPNLDQLNILAIRYRGLSDFCAEESLFGSTGSPLQVLSPGHRAELYQVLFDEMRRALCLESRYLDSVEQDKARNNAFTYLHERWAFAHDENLETAKLLVLGKRPEHRGAPRSDLVSGGPRSRLLKQVKMAGVWKNTPLAGSVLNWKEAAWVELIESMLQAAVHYGYVNKHPIDNKLVGWRLNAAAMDWCLIADGHDSGSSSNAFFRQLYLQVAELLRQPGHPLFDFEAQEHTAQVEGSRRQWLEQRFRFTEKDRQDWSQNPAHEAPLERLPVMFCSPTMELGVDISALNTVYLRNVPPTPANYAQRSGRAGRSGQQALVITYCAAQSPHDQWFFRHASDMVHGVVKPPTLDLANRDLVESHLRAVWLASAEVGLDNSIAPLLDLNASGKPVNPELLQCLSDPRVLQRARVSAHAVVDQLQTELADSDWFSTDYINTVIDDSPLAFSRALERWRVLFDATRKQMEIADEIVKSHSATHAERNNASRRYGDAARQYAVLLKTGNTPGTDFYTYRYLASQGFLPGYNFPRLPLMAWIPARGGTGASGGDDEGSMVSRPRFLALSEFGPRSLIYHQGRMYRVIRAKLNVGSADHVSGSGQLSTIASRICSQCGYGHLGEPGDPEPLVDRCEHCDALLTDNDWVRELYRIETVETIAVERISINDEDRQRQGFELQTTYRFLPGPDGKIQKSRAEVRHAGDVLLELLYTPAARLWRINRGWRRRKDKAQLGFYINPISGTWSKQDDPTADESSASSDEPAQDRVPNQRIVPFVEDHRNLLILRPGRPLSPEAMATLQAALKRGIEMCFQIEEAELVAEPLPTADDRKALMFYESAEGGAGVLTRLANEPDSLAQVAAAALRLMHFNPPAGPWVREDLAALEHRPDGVSICEAGCYQCLLSYFNQPDHDHINRRNSDVLDVLVALANAQVGMTASVVGTPPGVVPSLGHDGRMTEWLEALDRAGLLRPEATAVPVCNGTATASAQYKDARALVFLAPLTDDQRRALIDKGWQVLDFSDGATWSEQFAAHPEVFGQAGTGA